MVVFVLLCLAAGSCRWVSAEQPRTGVVRDWQKYPAIVEVDTASEIIALGDVHGDYDRLLGLLLAGKIIPRRPEQPDQVEWRAGGAILVCTGDLIDKGDHAVEVLALLRALQGTANRSGGRVIVTMGNHEAAFLADPVKGEKAKVFREELGQHGIKPEDVAAGRDGLGLGAFLSSLPFAARVNDWFFVHAGPAHGRPLKQLRSLCQAGVAEQGYGCGILLAPDGLLEVRLHPQPWWEKPGDRPAASQARLLAAVQALDVKHLVIGHQPGKVEFSDGSKRRKGEIYQKFDGLIFLIDVGMSRGVDETRQGYSTGALLHIHGKDKPKADAIFADGSRRRLWSAP
jgi:hypothetical protein